MSASRKAGRDFMAANAPLWSLLDSGSENVNRVVLVLFAWPQFWKTIFTTKLILKMFLALNVDLQRSSQVAYKNKKQDANVSDY